MANKRSVLQLCLSVLVSLGVLLGSFSARALELYTWEAHAGAPLLILPVADGETPAKAAERYISSAATNSDLQRLFSRHPLQLNGRVFKKLGDSDIDRRALLIANKADDLRAAGTHPTLFNRVFKSEGTTSYILPVAADLGLNADDSAELRRSVIDRFPLLVAMGGDDVDPQFYNDSVRYSVNTNVTRDRFEATLIREYVDAAKGFFLGVCRGSQLTSAILGYKLIQDIPIEVGRAVAHGDNWHSIELMRTSNGLLASVLSGQSVWSVNSYHHQSVIFQPGGFLEIAARSQDGVTEALEFKNGRGLLLQFHPEYMENDLGNKILLQVLGYKNRQFKNRMCSAVFASGL